MRLQYQENNGNIILGSGENSVDMVVTCKVLGNPEPSAISLSDCEGATTRWMWVWENNLPCLRYSLASYESLRVIEWKPIA